ncbi:RES family NAD+ phosphorylase [Salinicola sp. DM10]|uniref:RES family NAD+ phosphorylase n=1 Tax=Salinicola sp. DM10 TaxID=2815721 RepID=UPI001E2C9227|nr:RES family NAD+ phosphorylase [Salinicola sp. DM10]MCE3028967.1 RES family NAD+ phosphorylase [Salinicola sp. DM10]
MGSHDDESTKIKNLVENLHKDGKLPAKQLKVGTKMYRIQDARHPTANHFSAPSVGLGRYNDPDGVMMVWYGAEHPTGALAETFAQRRYSNNAHGIGWMFNEADIASRNMCEVKVERELNLLDLKVSLSRLRITLDKITGPDYTLTQEIVRVVSRLSGNRFDGIIYESRHHPDGRLCYALWVAPGEQNTVSEGEMINLSEYKFRGYMPEIDSDCADAEEVLTEILGYEVMSNP